MSMRKHTDWLLSLKVDYLYSLIISWEKKQPLKVQ